MPDAGGEGRADNDSGMMSANNKQQSTLKGVVIRVVRRRSHREIGDTSTMTTLEGKDKWGGQKPRMWGDNGGHSTSNDVANTQPLLRMMRRRGREGDGECGCDGRGGEL